MLVFKLWSQFGVFRDPITITQNISLSIPPKTTIGGMLAAILGIDYNDYFNNQTYFDFGYSLVLNNSIRKQSFTQNYIGQYTKRCQFKNNGMESIEKGKKLRKKEKMTLSNFRFSIKKEPNFKSPTKPIRREILLNPSYLIFIKDFIYEKELIENLKRHNSAFSLYMGNSEFSANYEYVDCLDVEEAKLTFVDSFTQSQENINFEADRKYTTIHAATRTVEGRKYRDFKKITISDKTISFYAPVDGYVINTGQGKYCCEFI